MVLKLFSYQDYLPVSFENDVKMYGTQTSFLLATMSEGFENDVKMYGTQTGCVI